ncbi:MAG: DUF58 domain-containing protein [Planctomycetota bacterium]|nr:DUF58 domain-containing protein [Planctomycetota bacterium]
MSELFTQAERARLDRLRIHRRRRMPGERHGDWRTARYGAGGLFADHRHYAPGDDLRYVDWNVYGRLGEMVVKRFEAEENLNLLLCVDRSLSMDGAKSRRARRVAAALGYIALAHMDHVRLAWLPSPTTAPVHVFRGRDGGTKLLEELARVPEGGMTDHARDLKPVISSTRQRSVAVLISDFYDPQTAVAGLGRLRARRFDVAALHVMDVADLDLPRGASVRALDRETGQAIDVDVTPELIDSLHEAWRRRAYLMERWCIQREILYQRVDVGLSLWETLSDMLARGVVAGVGA